MSRLTDQLRAVTLRTSRDRGPVLRFDRRSSGVLLHPTSLPGSAYSGDLGDEALRFIDLLRRGRQSWWQMLPTNPPGGAPGYSPYSSSSAFAGSPWLINLQRLVEQGLLDQSDVRSVRETSDNCDFAASIRYRLPGLRRAAARFAGRGGFETSEYLQFRGANSTWLDDFVLFSAIKDAHEGASWCTWSRNLRLRDPDALRSARQELAESVHFHEFVQFQYHRQWAELRGHARRAGIGLIGDIPIFVGHDSADVWAHRELFLLDRAGQPRTKSGCPPDAFNPLGQAWGHPQYDWEAHVATGFAWWIDRFRVMLRAFDAARIDHFLGFNRAWHIPGRAETACIGRWRPGPGAAVFKAVRRALGEVPIIAEDLGLLTPEAAALRDQFKFPGMRVMQFGFGPGGDYHLPHRYPHRCVAYTGTHDNSTIVGWLQSLQQINRNGHSTPATRAELAKARRYLRSDLRQFHWDAIRALVLSVADTVIFPVQDLLGLDDSARMNRPGTIKRNWRWRLTLGQLGNEVADQLAELCSLGDRLPPTRSDVRRPPRISRSTQKC